MDQRWSFILIGLGILFLFIGFVAFFYPSWADLIVGDDQIPPLVDHPYRYVVGLPFLILGAVCLSVGVVTIMKRKQKAV